MFCGECGKSNVDGVKFCVHCGADLTRLTPPASGGTLDASASQTPRPTPNPADTLDAGATIFAGQLRAGKMLAGQYRIIGDAPLGSGGMGEVWQAEDVELGTAVAIKVLPPVLARDKVAIAALKREATIGRQLTHPNICRLYSFHSDGQLKFIVMEYVDGKTLAEAIGEHEDGRLTWDVLAPIASQAAEALDYAHSVAYTGAAGRQVTGVLHRDIKPANIMVTADGRVKLMDFGIAREIHNSMTRVTGRTSQTPLYASPEQFRGQPMTPASDIYSFTAVLYECLAGRPIISAHGDLAWQVLEKSFEPLAAQTDVVNAALQAGLAKEPGDRPATAVALSESLSAVRVPAEAVSAEPVPVGYSNPGAPSPVAAPESQQQIRSKMEPEVYAAWPFDSTEASRRQDATAARLGIPATRTLDLGGGQTMRLVLIPAGEFDMGSPKSEQDMVVNSGVDREYVSNEGPVHRVRITKPFYMSVTEVTQGQWEQLMGTTLSQQRDKEDSSWALYGQGASYPMYYVSWSESASFCERLSGVAEGTVRLPTEAEWEYACRAGTATAMNSGKSLTSTIGECRNLNALGWYDENSGSTTHVVGQKAANGFGLYDMHGNVWEWCSDKYDSDYYGTFTNANIDDPQGATSGSSRVLRGGCWVIGARGCRSAYRHGGAADFRYSSVGFRVVVDLK